MEEEAQAFAKEFSSYIAKPCQAEKIEALFDFSTFVNRMLPPSLSPAQRSEHIADLETRQLAGYWFCGMLRDVEMTFLLVQLVRGEPKPLYRRLRPRDVPGSSATELNYVRIDLTKSNGKVKMVDWTDFRMGQLTSEAYRDVFHYFPKVPSNGIGEALEMISNKIRSQDFAAARTSIANLREGMPRKRYIRLLEVAASQDLPDEQYVQALQKFEAEFPSTGANEKSGDLMLTQLDVYAYKEKWGDFISLSEELNKIIGGDAQLITLRAEAHLLRDKFSDLEQAVVLIKAAMAAEPKLEYPPALLIRVQIARKDRKGLAEAIGLYFKATGDRVSKAYLAKEASEEMLRGPEFDELEKTGALDP